MCKLLIFLLLYPCLLIGQTVVPGPIDCVGCASGGGSGTPGSAARGGARNNGPGTTVIGAGDVDVWQSFGFGGTLSFVDYPDAGLTNFTRSDNQVTYTGSGSLEAGFHMELGFSVDLGGGKCDFGVSVDDADPAELQQITLALNDVVETGFYFALDPFSAGTTLEPKLKCAAATTLTHEYNSHETASVGGTGATGSVGPAGNAIILETAVIDPTTVSAEGDSTAQMAETIDPGTVSRISCWVQANPSGGSVVADVKRLRGPIASPTVATIGAVTIVAGQPTGFNDTGLANTTYLSGDRVRATVTTANASAVDLMCSATVPTTGGGAAQGLDAVLSSSCPQFTIGAATLTNASTTEDETLFPLPGGAKVIGASVQHSTAFSGGTLTAMTVSVGDSSSVVFYTSPFDLFAAASDTNFQDTNMFKSSTSLARPVLARFTATGDNMVNVTAGSVDIVVCWTQLP